MPLIGRFAFLFIVLVAVVVAVVVAVLVAVPVGIIVGVIVAILVTVIVAFPTKEVKRKTEVRKSSIDEFKNQSNQSTYNQSTEKCSDESNGRYIQRKGVHKELCERIVKAAKKLPFDTDPEPVDEEPLYQIDIYNDGEVLNEELWNACESIYRTYKEHPDSDDFMFLKRYTAGERTRLKAHVDTANYTVSVLLSDTSDFEGCEFFLFDKESTKRIFPTYEQLDPEEKDRYIASLGKLPIVKLEQGDVIRFDSDCLHGVTHLTGGERYLLTIFYGSLH